MRVSSQNKLIHQWECYLQGARCLFKEPMGCLCCLHPDTPFAPRHHQTAQVTPGDKSLKSEMLYICITQPAFRKPERDNADAKSNKGAGTFPFSMDAGSSKRSASILERRDANKGLHLYSPTYFSATNGNKGMGTVLGWGMPHFEEWGAGLPGV